MSELEILILAATDAHARLAERLEHRQIRRRLGGKPWVQDGPHFNLSHSGDVALIAVCPDVPVGVDVERVRAVANLPGLARRMCSAREGEWLAAARDPALALLRLWVRKEAVAKAEGGGIATALSGLDVLGPVAEYGEARYAVWDLPDPASGYLAAVSWLEPSPNDRP